MTKSGNLKRKSLGTVIGAAAILVVVTVPGRAFAQSSNGAILQVGYSANSGNPQLFLLQGSVSFFAQKTPPAGCGVPQIDIEAIKTWQSIAQAAKLSGKATTIYYTTCNGANYMNDVVMIN